MKLSTSILALVAGLGLTAQAATVSVSNLPGGLPVPLGNTDPDGTILAAGGGFVAIGTFADAGALTDVAAIQGAFQQFGDALGIGLGANGGIYQGTVTATVADTAFSGANVFTVIGNGSDLQSSQGLLVVDHGFSFVDEPGATNDAVVALDSTLVFGSTNPNQLTVNGRAFDALQLAPIIPEPSSALLGLLGLSFLAFRRRK